MPAAVALPHWAAPSLGPSDAWGGAKRQRLGEAEDSAHALSANEEAADHAVLATASLRELADKGDELYRRLCGCGGGGGGGSGEAGALGAIDAHLQEAAAAAAATAVGSAELTCFPEAGALAALRHAAAAAGPTVRPCPHSRMMQRHICLPLPCPHSSAEGAVAAAGWYCASTVCCFCCITS